MKANKLYQVEVHHLTKIEFYKVEAKSSKQALTRIEKNDRPHVVERIHTDCPVGMKFIADVKELKDE